jgi:DNA-directed RNA polymerase subunit P
MESGPEATSQEAPLLEPSARNRSPGGLFYECINCGSRLTADQLAMTPEIKCPFCGYRILRKVRPPIVKHVKAR